jgi:hypothetical protein
MATPIDMLAVAARLSVTVQVAMSSVVVPMDTNPVKLVVADVDAPIVKFAKSRTHA